jgi:hypothetical protein
MSCNPNREVVPCFYDEGHWKWGTFHKIRKLDHRSTTKKSLPNFAPSFSKWLSQGGSNKYSPLGLGNHYLYMPTQIPHRLFIHGKKTRAQVHIFLGLYPKTEYCLFPPITTLHFFGHQPFASRCKQPFISKG